MSNTTFYSQDAFLKLPNMDAKKYIFYNGFVSKINTDIHKVDNDEIFAFFKNDYTLLDKKTYFFRRCINQEFIVYDKKTSKVRISKKVGYDLSNKFVNYFFKGELARAIALECITKGFIKKVIENKINTVENIVKYYRSYILKQKSASLLGVTNFLCVSHNVYIKKYVAFIKNWDLLLNPNNITKLLLLEDRKLHCLNKEFHTEEDLDFRKIYNEYENWQSKVSREINAK